MGAVRGERVEALVAAVGRRAQPYGGIGNGPERADALRSEDLFLEVRPRCRETEHSQIRQEAVAGEVIDVGVDKVPPGGLRPVVALETYGTVQRVERQTGPRRGIWNRCHGWNGRFHLANGFIVPFGALASGYPACRRRR